MTNLSNISQLTPMSIVRLIIKSSKRLKGLFLHFFLFIMILALLGLNIIAVKEGVFLLYIIFLTIIIILYQKYIAIKDTLRVYIILHDLKIKAIINDVVNTEKAPVASQILESLTNSFNQYPILGNSERIAAMVIQQTALVRGVKSMRSNNRENIGSSTKES